MLNIIVVEDHDILREELVRHLNTDSWSVRGVGDGAELNAIWAQQPADILILDLNLPKEDGISIAQRMRQAKPDLAIVMFTARVTQQDRALGYGFGADVYLSKPANVGELESVIANLERRIKPVELAAASVGANTVFTLDLTSRCLIKPLYEPMPLTKREQALISALIPGKHLLALDLCDILDAANLYEWQNTSDKTEDRIRRLTVLLSRLRKKLDTYLDERDLIRTDYGNGYFLAAPVVVTGA